MTLWEYFMGNRGVDLEPLILTIQTEPWRFLVSLPRFLRIPTRGQWYCISRTEGIVCYLFTEWRTNFTSQGKYQGFGASSKLTSFFEWSSSHYLTVQWLGPEPEWRQFCVGGKWTTAAVAAPCVLMGPRSNPDEDQFQTGWGLVPCKSWIPQAKAPLSSVPRVCRQAAWRMWSPSLSSVPINQKLPVKTNTSLLIAQSILGIFSHNSVGCGSSWWQVRGSPMWIFFPLFPRRENIIWAVCARENGLSWSQMDYHF